MAAMTLDEFFDMAELGGRIKACYDIFEILKEENLSPTEVTEKLSKYKEDAFKKFQKAQLKFRMADGKVRMDEDSIETL